MNLEFNSRSVAAEECLSLGFHAGRPFVPQMRDGAGKTASNFKKDILPSNNTITEEDYKVLIRDVHTRCVTETIATYTENRVLQAPPPAIAPDEARLPRRTRSILSQLRSAKCSKLNCYRSRLDPAVEDRCPECGTTPHDTGHLFSCPVRPTTLTTAALWNAFGDLVATTTI